MAVVINGTTGITTPTYNGSTSAEYLVPVTAFKNRIINGAMMIDQRNAGAAVTVNSGTYQYPVDRFGGAGLSSAGVFTLQQDSSAPAGFSNSIKWVTTTTATPSTTNSYFVEQKIEGYNIADLAWGTASAKTITLSFWTRSSLTGTFGGSIGNNAANRWYPFSYTINSADTWEYKTVTISGETSGTWLTTNGEGMRCIFCLGAGPSRLGTAGSWTTSIYIGPTGLTQVISTLNATWYITGVQLEVGSSATSFDYRPYGTELALCQRYYYLHASGNDKPIGNACNYSTTAMYGMLFLPVTMRIAPTISQVTGTSYYRFYRNDAPDYFNSFSLQTSSTTAYAFYNPSEISGTAGHAGWVETNNASAFVAFSAEL